MFHLIKRRKFLISTIIIGSALIYGCKKTDFSKITGLGLDQNLVAPIGFGEFGINDFKMVDTSIVVDQNTGEMSLVYHKDLDTIYANQVVELDDYTQNFNLVPPSFGSSTTPGFNGTISSSTVENSDFPTQDGIELHTLNFESGLLTINASTTIQHDVTIVINMLDLSKNSVAVVRTLDMVYTGSVPQTIQTTVNLADVLADFTAGGGNVNRLRFSIDVTITGTGQPIAGTESLDLSMTLSDLEFKNITGYFGQQVLTDVTDTLLLKIFNNSMAGSLSFTNPQLTFNIDNSFGIPVDINFSNFISIDSATGVSVPISGFPSVLSVNIPSGFGQSAITKLEINANNTPNISSVVNASPRYLQYSISATTNPNGNVAPLNFIESTSRIIVSSDIILPFEGYASGIEVKDTLDFEFNTAVSNVASAMFRLNVDNGFPITFTGQAVFVDENYTPLFSLMNTPTTIVSAAPVNSAGMVTSRTNKVTDITIDDAKIKLLGNVKYVLISGLAGTTLPSGTPVKLYDYYKLGIKLGMQVQLKSN